MCVHVCVFVSCDYKQYLLSFFVPLYCHGLLIQFNPMYLLNLHGHIYV